MSMDDGQHALLQDLMQLAPDLVEKASGVLSPIARTRQQLRAILEEKEWIIKVPDNPDMNPPTSMCAIDGARVTERMYGADLFVAVATNANALYSETNLPGLSSVWADIMPHDQDLERIVGSAMAAMELTVATDSPHEIRLLDGAFITQVLEPMKGLSSKNKKVRSAVTTIIRDHKVAERLNTILTYDATRPIYALPKSESGRTYGKIVETLLGKEYPVSDRVLAAQILDAGEILRPVPLDDWSGIDIKYHKDATQVTQRAAKELAAAIEPFKNRVAESKALTCYYKQIKGSHVLRYEYLTDTPDDEAMAIRIAQLLSHETNAPHTLEPIAQWAVDRKAKSISIGTKALRASMLNQLTEEQGSTWGKFIAEDYRT